MIRYQPLRGWDAPVAPLATPFDKLDLIAWVPIAESELLLCAHYYALAIHMDDAQAQVAAILRPDMLERNHVGKDGKWTGAYSPIALRCFPFRLSGKPTGNPIEDLDLAPIKPDGAQPRVIKLKDAEGKPTPQLQSIYDGLKGVRESQDTFQRTIDTLLVADLLVPLKPRSEGRPAPGLFTVDRRRFSGLSPLALEAAAKHTFAPVDLATALTFSQVHLREEFRPALAAAPQETPAQASPAARDASGAIDTLTPWLDTSELFPGAWAADPSIWSAAAQPAGKNG